MNWNPLIINGDSFHGGIFGDKCNLLVPLSSFVIYNVVANLISKYIY